MSFLRLAQILSLLCAAPALFPQDRTPAGDPDQNQDVRAIYSWVINHSTRQDKLLVIAPESDPPDYPQARCLEVPPDRAADFREVRADFERRKNTTAEIPGSLSTSKPYAILDPEVAKEVILKSARVSESPIIKERYPGVEHLLLFSSVYFNQKRSVALVQADWWCGGLWGYSTWTAFEKGKGGVWEMRPWVQGCVRVAEGASRPPLAYASAPTQNNSFSAN